MPGTRWWLGPSGEVRTHFVYASRGNVADYLVRGSRTYRIVADHLGSVRLVVDAATGEVVQRLDYDAFGQTRLDTNPGFQPFGYAGGLVDEHTDLVHFGARDYDPALGRWTARDPVGFGGGANHYAYVGNDPVNNIDPSGLSAVGCLQDVLGLAGMLPVVGGAFDLANAAIYASRGNWGDAGLALGAVLLPVSLAGLGGAAKAGARWGDDAAGAATGVGRSSDPIEIGVSRSRYPQSARHIDDAQAAGPHRDSTTDTQQYQ